jgi:hypothetical protein
VDERVSPPVLDIATLSSVKLTMLHSPHYFKLCKISAVALIKMVRFDCLIVGGHVHANRIGVLGFQVIHARSGVPWEIMGLMQGKVVGHSIVIMDSFALPVQGTETRVNAANEANEYMVQYIQESEKVRPLTFVCSTMIDYGPIDNPWACRWDGWRMRSDGTTRILGTAVGSLASTSTRR